MKFEIKNLLLLLFVLVVCLILGEVVLSILDIPKFSTPGDSYRISDEVKHHGLIPNTTAKLRSDEFDINYFINSFGLRDKEFNLSKNKYRALMLGDSFTEGVGVNIENTIPKKVEMLLKSKGYNIEVINSGVSSYSPILEYIYFKNEGYKFNPDLVILNLDISDIQDDYRYENISIKDKYGNVLAVPGSRTVPRWRNKLRDWCSKYNINICVGVFHTYSTLKGTDKKRVVDVIPGEITSDRLFPTRFNLTKEQKAHYGRTFTYIKKIKDFAESKGANFVLVAYPYGHQVNGKEMAERRKYLKYDEYPIYSLDFFKDVKAFADKNKINYIDTYYKFNNTPEFPLFYSYDIHMTERGYELVAEGITEGLLGNELLSEIKA